MRGNSGNKRNWKSGFHAKREYGFTHDAWFKGKLILHNFAGRDLVFLDGRRLPAEGKVTLPVVTWQTEPLSATVASPDGEWNTHLVFRVYGVPADRTDRLWILKRAREVMEDRGRYHLFIVSYYTLYMLRPIFYKITNRSRGHVLFAMPLKFVSKEDVWTRPTFLIPTDGGLPAISRLMPVIDSLQRQCGRSRRIRAVLHNRTHHPIQVGRRTLPVSEALAWNGGWHVVDARKAEFKGRLIKVAWIVRRISRIELYDLIRVSGGLGMNDSLHVFYAPMHLIDVMYPQILKRRDIDESRAVLSSPMRQDETASDVVVSIPVGLVPEYAPYLAGGFLHAVDDFTGVDGNSHLGDARDSGIHDAGTDGFLPGRGMTKTMMKNSVVDLIPDILHR